MKHRSRDPGGRILSSQSNISRAMRERIPKIPNFTAIRKQRNKDQATSNSKLTLRPQSTSSLALQQVPSAVLTTQGKRASDTNRRSPSYYGFDNPSSDLTITAPPKQPSRAGDVVNFQPPPASVVDTVQTIAIQQLEEANISPVIGAVSPPDPHVCLLIDQQTSTVDNNVKSMSVYEAEGKNCTMNTIFVFHNKLSVIHEYILRSIHLFGAVNFIL